MKKPINKTVVYKDYKNTTWYAKNGKSITVSEMSVRHLENIKNTIERNSTRNYFCNVHRERWLNILYTEIERRKSFKKPKNIKKSIEGLTDKLFNGVFKKQLGGANVTITKLKDK